MRILDAFCCAGGATRGYQQAGHHVTGVDHEPQPRYCGDAFILADAVEYIRAHGAGYDFIHASPPCQSSCALTKGTNRGRTYPDLIADTRQAMRGTGRPGVIENVQGSELRRDVTLCGEMFGLDVIRHRYFEAVGWRPSKPKHAPHRGRVRGWRHGVYYDGPYIAAYGRGGGKGTAVEMQEAMGIDWTSDHRELTEAIPPAYTAWVIDELCTTLRAGTSVGTK